jgi:hypothetical protein
MKNQPMEIFIEDVASCIADGWERGQSAEKSINGFQIYSRQESR